MKVRVERGRRITKTMPATEVCMSMGITDTQMECELLEHNAVQLYKEGRQFSSPILPGEAGLYNDCQGYYYLSNGWDSVGTDTN